MHPFVAPLCLVLALAMVVAGFALWAVDAPQPTVELHRAAASGDDPYRDALEAQLRRRRLKRTVLLGCLFGGSAVMIVTALATMRPAPSAACDDSSSQPYDQD